MLLAVQATAALAAPPAPGALDTTFAGFTDDGVVFESGIQTTGSIALQPDGKTVMVGFTGTVNQLGVFRYLPNGLLDPAFDGDGKAIFSNLFTATKVALQSDGRILVGGTLNDDIHMARLTSSGALDTSFDFDGWFADVDAQLASLQDIAVQSDGKIVACGSAEVGGDSDFGVARYDINGWRDTTFSGDGKVTIPFGGEDVCESVVQQRDGKLVLAGGRDSTSIFGDDDFAVARLTIDGALDGTFDGDGRLTTGFGGDEGATDVALQLDGKIVVLGSRFSPESSYLARYLPTGALDSTFDGDGKRSIPVDRLTALAPQPDGKLLALGYRHDDRGYYDFILYRLLSNSALDMSFDFDGAAQLDFGGRYDKGADLALLPDGRILVAGTRNTTGVLARLWQDGTNFDKGGQQAHRTSAYFSDAARALAVQPDGSFLVAGETYAQPSTSYTNAFVTRFRSNGQVDTSFGSLGTVQTSPGFITPNFRGARAIVVQPDGKIVIAGYGKVDATDSWPARFLVARWNSDGTPDFGFGLSGWRLAGFPGNGNNYGSALALAPDGKIIVVGNVWNGSRYIWGVIRLLIDGNMDTTFGPNHDGVAYVDFLGSNSANAVVVQPDGKIVIAGTFNSNFAIARLLDSGLLDTGFGSGGTTITDMGGNDGISALVLAPNGWFFAAGYSGRNGAGDFALTQYQPNGQLAKCPSGQTCSYWPEGKRFVGVGGQDLAYALALRGDNQVAVAGCSDGHMAAAQVSTTDVNAAPLLFQTDFVGYYECAYGVQFSGTSQDRIVLAGQQSYGTDTNIALARFQTTAYKKGSTLLAPADRRTSQDGAVPSPSPAPLAPTEQQPTPDSAVPTPSPTAPAPTEQQPTPDSAVPSPSPTAPAPTEQQPTPDSAVPAPAPTEGQPIPDSAVPSPSPLTYTSY